MAVINLKRNVNYLYLRSILLCRKRVYVHISSTKRFSVFQIHTFQFQLALRHVTLGFIIGNHI